MTTTKQVKEHDPSSYFKWYVNTVKIPAKHQTIETLCHQVYLDQEGFCPITGHELICVPGHLQAPYLRFNNQSWLPPVELVCLAFKPVKLIKLLTFKEKETVRKIKYQESSDSDYHDDYDDEYF